jgi:hypothetical protein
MKRGGKGMNPHDYSGACLSVRCAHGWRQPWIPKEDHSSSTWQFFLLADQLKQLIERSQDNSMSLKVGPDPKHDYYHRLFFML